MGEKCGQIWSNLVKSERVTKTLPNRYQIVTKFMCKIETWIWTLFGDDFVEGDTFGLKLA
ncbi:hypothetical protein SEA_JODELIE19_86 [Gordonia phage Jodelie19]|nr:hypothetical protein SEA_JODELIE19_86 [Gordonia phage Jodelie19]